MNGPRLDLHHELSLSDARLELLIRQGDGWRRSPGSAGGTPGHKEWSHFCVLADDVTLLINFSLADAPYGGGTQVEVPRLTLLARSADGWFGDVDRFDGTEVDVRGGGIDIAMRANRLAYRDGAYGIEVRLARQRVAAVLEIRPIARPALTSSIPLGGRAMRWFVVPHLLANGWVEVAGRRIVVRNAPAYHDHDWGNFAWGGDYSWEWATALSPAAAEPSRISLIFQRIGDRGRLRSLSQGLLLWRGASHVRTLHDSEVEVRTSGCVSVRDALRVPGVMKLAAPGCAADVPRRLEVRGVAGDDCIEAGFEIEDVAQIAIPSDVEGERATVISEAHARVRVDGRIRGEPMRFTGPAILELNRAAA